MTTKVYMVIIHLLICILCRLRNSANIAYENTAIKQASELVVELSDRGEI